MVVQIPDGFTVEQVPIQFIRHGDAVIGYAGEDLKAFVFEVDEIRGSQKQGEPSRMELRSARETDAYGTGLVASFSRPLGTLVERIVPLAKETAQ